MIKMVKRALSFRRVARDRVLVVVTTSTRRLDVSVGDRTVVASAITEPLPKSGVDKPVGQGVGIVLSVNVDEEENEGESELGCTGKSVMGIVERYHDDTHTSCTA